MPDSLAALWVSQADSDRHAASRVYDPSEDRTFCQAIAKYQQTVEKSIKAIAAAVNDAGVATIAPSHYYNHDVDRLISALRHLPRPKDRREIVGLISGLLNEWLRLEIKALSDLAPKRPSPGALHLRNSEYPYETAAGNWTAPALPGAFSTQEVGRFLSLADRVYEGTRRIVSALRRRTAT
jgi:hypothetical protein